MKRTFIVSLILLFSIAFSCSSDDVSAENSSCKLMNFTAHHLDKAELGSFHIMIENPTVYLSYEDNKVVKTEGGLRNTFIGPTFLESRYDSIVHETNKIINIKRDSEDQDLVFIDTLFFTTDNNNKVLSKSYRFSNGSFLYDYHETFNYENGKVVSSTVMPYGTHGETNKTYFYEDDNLVRIESESNYLDLYIRRAVEYFENYDTNENPFYEQNLFFIRGTFYRSFSKNNYTRRRKIEESFDINTNEWVETSSSTQEFVFEYNENDLPDIGEYNCN